MGGLDGPLPVCHASYLGPSAALYRRLSRLHRHDSLFCCRGEFIDSATVARTDNESFIPLY